MIEISNSAAQTLEVGQAILFDVTNLKTRCTAECHRAGMSDVKLRLPGIYEVAFSGNIAGVAAGTVQLSISAGNAVLPRLQHDRDQHRCRGCLQRGENHAAGNWLRHV